MESLRKGLTSLLNVLTGVCFLAMVGLTFWQVVMRYFFDSPVTWSEELVSYLFAWASLLGACLVTGERGHMNIPILGQKLMKSNMASAKNLAIFGEIIAFIFSIGILCFGGAQIASLAMGQETSSLGVAVGVFYVLLPVAGVLNALFAAINIHDIAKGTMQPFPED